jgi:meso-butanediol dehydrogenase/(S,S)-butanediol dehydrogenase/diacetyl reductase
MPGDFSRDESMQLNGKTVLVTGAGRGIGKAIATGFARNGADIVVVSRTLGEIEETAREVNAAGRRALAIQADVSQLNDVRRVADEVANRFGRLDILVNNAALRMNQLGQKNSYTIPFTELTVEDWDSAINVNLRGPFLCIKEFLPLIRKSGGGSIINISAGGGKRGMAGRVPYCASKFGLEGLTQSLALEFQSFNIAVNSLSPGKHSILTDPAKRQQLKETPEIVFMRPEMMVPPALFLATQDGHGATGQHIEALAWLSQNGLGGREEWRVRV